MKIQFGEKGEVPWDVLLETVQKEYPEPQVSVPSFCSRIRKKCCTSWLSLLILVGVVAAAQAWVLLYFLHAWSSFYTHAGHVVLTDNSGNFRHVHFSWSNCGSHSDPIKLDQLQVNPDPVQLQGNITINLNSYLDVDLDSPISAAVKVERRIGWVWVKIPCVDGLGSCHYSDVCSLIPFPPSEPCPDPFPRFHLPCRCPIPKGHYVVEDGVFNIPGILDIIPGWLVKGDYYVKVAGYNKENSRLGCYTVYASVTD